MVSCCPPHSAALFNGVRAMRGIYFTTPGVNVLAAFNARDVPFIAGINAIASPIGLLLSRAIRYASSTSFGIGGGFILYPVAPSTAPPTNADVAIASGLTVSISGRCDGFSSPALAKLRIISFCILRPAALADNFLKSSLWYSSATVSISSYSFFSNPYSL